MYEKANRFQYQTWYIKLWRLRYYLLVPFLAISMWRYRKENETDFFLCWQFAVGLMQIKMCWIYDRSDYNINNEITTKK